MCWICCNCGAFCDDGIPVLRLCMSCADDPNVIIRECENSVDDPDDYDYKYDGDYHCPFE